MSNYNSLKTTINANIKQNGNQEITGQILNSVLNQMVTTLGAGYQFAGVATTATNPGSPDAKVFYIANGKGTYTNFSGLEVTEDDVVVLYWDSSWHKVSTGIASQVGLEGILSKVNEDRIQYNILDYDGETLNEKWDNMRTHFVAWVKKQVVVPYPREGVQGCVKVGNDWKWAIDDALLFDDKCNEMDINICGELYAIAPVDNVIVIDDVDKPENIYFTNGFSIRGNRQIGNTIGTAIEVRGASRLNFEGQILINDCNKGVVVGGENQVREASVNFEYLSVGFADECGVEVGGNIGKPCSFNADIIEIQILQQENKNAIELWNNCIQFTSRVVRYATDIVRQGYESYNARAVVNISQKEDIPGLIRNILIDDIYGTWSKYGVYAVGRSTGSCYNMHFKSIAMPQNLLETGVAIHAEKCGQILVDNVGIFNVVELSNCVYSSVNGVVNYGDSIIPRNSQVDGFMKEETSILTPSSSLSVSGRLVGSESIASFDFNEVGAVHIEKIFKRTPTGMIPYDGQMFCPIVDALPVARWYWRGKFFMILNSDGTDGVYVCIKTASGAYKWLNISDGIESHEASINKQDVEIEENLNLSLVALSVNPGQIAKVSGAIVSKSIPTAALEFYQNNNVEEVYAIGKGCTSLNSAFRASSIKKMYGELWDVSSVTNMHTMANQSTQLERIGDLSKWDTSLVTDMESMFTGCSLVEWMGVPPIPAGVIGSTTIFSKMTSLKNIVACGKISSSVSFYFSPLTRDSYLKIANALDPSVSGKTLTINPATRQLLSNEDIELVTNKGWTLS